MLHRWTKDDGLASTLRFAATILTENDKDSGGYEIHRLLAAALPLYIATATVAAQDGRYALTNAEPV